MEGRIALQAVEGINSVQKRTRDPISNEIHERIVTIRSSYSGFVSTRSRRQDL